MTEPTALVSGKFTLYQTPKGGMHLTMLVEGEEEPRHIEIPAMMVKLMQRKFGAENGLAPAEVYLPDSVIDVVPESEWQNG